MCEVTYSRLQKKRIRKCRRSSKEKTSLYSSRSTRKTGTKFYQAFSSHVCHTFYNYCGNSSSCLAFFTPGHLCFWKHILWMKLPLMNQFQVQVWFFNRQAKFLRDSVEMLKRNVPTISGMTKASKEIILKEATNYCHLLIEQDKKIRIAQDELMVKNARLQKKLRQLLDQPFYQKDTFQ